MKKIIMICTLIAVFMFGFSFALAPLYNSFCKLAGIPRLLTEKEFFEKADATREITVEFTATNNKELTWDFYPLSKKVIVHPGENATTLFFARNTSQQTMTVQAIPSIVPTAAIAHFHKIQCFCFKQQTLKANESLKMPVVFKVDRELPKDIHTITLAYTLFDVTKN
jgi:cytochrome c oxidase assembly protein subunit 11